MPSTNYNCVYCGTPLHQNKSRKLGVCVDCRKLEKKGSR